MAYDRSLFIEVIESIQGVKFLRSDLRHGIHARFYEGITGKLCTIDTTDFEDDILNGEGIGYLTQLGLEYLITTLFPSTAIAESVLEESIREDKE